LRVGVALVGEAFWIFRRVISRFDESISLRDRGLEMPIAGFSGGLGGGTVYGDGGFTAGVGAARGAGAGVMLKPTRRPMGISSQSRMLVAGRIVGRDIGVGGGLEALAGTTAGFPCCGRPREGGGPTGRWVHSARESYLAVWKSRTKASSRMGLSRETKS
jgi:hypothetical protein